MSNMAKDVMKGTLAAFGIVEGAALLIAGGVALIMNRKAKKALKEFEEMTKEYQN